MATPRTSSTGGGGGVKGLRAMFEKSSDPSNTSPPSRGRSPAGSDASLNHSRPVSKVRASFVAVERPGEGQGQGQQMWGLRKASDVSSMAEVKEEVDREKHNESAIIEEDPSPSAAKATMNGTRINGSDDHTTSSGGKKTSPQLPYHAPQPASQGVSKSQQSRQEDTAKAARADDPMAKATAAIQPPKNGSKMNGINSHTKPSNEANAPPPKISTALESAARTPSSQKLPTKASADLSKPSNPPITPTQQQPIVKGSPHKAAAVSASAKAAQAKQSSPKVARKSSRPSLTHTSGTKASAAKARPEPSKKTENSSSPPGKMRPKSPTRPVRLPASATAPTASSAAKTGGPLSRSPSRASTTNAGLGRKPSTLKRELPTAKTPAASTLAKRASRPSLISQTKEQDRPRSRSSTISKPADNSFLARMMRPTASSAQKTHEKTDVKTPPRSKGKAPAIRRPSLKTEHSEASPKSGSSEIESHSPSRSKDDTAHPLQDAESPLPEATPGHVELDNGTHTDPELAQKVTEETLEEVSRNTEEQEPTIDVGNPVGAESSKPEQVVKEASEAIDVSNKAKHNDQPATPTGADDHGLITHPQLAAEDLSSPSTPALSDSKVEEALTKEVNGHTAPSPRQEVPLEEVSLQEGSKHEVPLEEANENAEAMKSELSDKMESGGPHTASMDPSGHAAHEVYNTDEQVKADFSTEPSAEAITSATDATDATKEESIAN